MKVVYYNVRKHFGDNNKLILYDLGGVKGQYKDDIAQMHNIELRQFDFTQFPEHVKDLHLFSWKILILAQVFNEATNIIYLDSSVYVLSSKYGPFFDQMTNFKLTPLLMIGRTHHSMGFATHPRMFDYLPLDFSVSKKSEMSEAGFLLLHRSESTRQLLKWATLCALTLDCINPPGSNITCDTTRINEIAVCNRQDQSVLNILLYNMGRQLKNKGYKTKSFGDPGYPRNINCLHEIRRRQGMVNNAMLMQFFIKLVAVVFTFGCSFIWILVESDFKRCEPIRIRRSREELPPRIAIVSVDYNANKVENYNLAEKTLLCYAKMHNYSYIEINFKEHANLFNKCPGNDAMFRRHCVVANFLKDNEDKLDWILFIDSDMGVINPNHTIEEYLDETADLIFHKLATNSYLARNTEYARNFLLKWSSYETKFNNFGDNIAIYEVYLNEFYPERQRCELINTKSYTSCVRSLLGDRQVFESVNGRLIQRSDAIKYWTRDAWLTNNFWSKDDFILHEWEESENRELLYNDQTTPYLQGTFNLSLCATPETAVSNWKYNEELMITQDELKERLETIVKRSYTRHLRRLDDIYRLYPLNWTTSNFYFLHE
ncbi:hypothetical protein M3Y97_01130400 [Aphelenchoides bicaudatus]|nr:hypothetical protein M3Y97_01130400 [Aphelenchoides bicaudatus]